MSASIPSSPGPPGATWLDLNRYIQQAASQHRKLSSGDPSLLLMASPCLLFSQKEVLSPSSKGIYLSILERIVQGKGLSVFCMEEEASCLSCL